MARRNSSVPTYAASCLSTLAPLAYVIPSKFTSTACTSGMSAAIGWDDGSWSCRYAQVFSMFANVVQAEAHRVACAWQSTETNVAKDSFNHRSSHQRIVTRSPNHM